MLGWRAKIGFIIPAHTRIHNRVFQMEVEAAVPDGVWIQYVHLEGPKSLSTEHLRGMHPQIAPAAREFSKIGVDVIIMGGIPICIVNGVGSDEKIIEVIEKAANVPATTSATSIVKALHKLEIEKVVVVMPYYPEEVAEMLRNFLEGAGFNIVSLVSREGVPVTAIHELPQQETYRTAKTAFFKAQDADGLLLAGAMPTSEIIEALETDLGKPVVALAYAAMWDALSIANVRQPIRGYGRLMTMF